MGTAVAIRRTSAEESKIVFEGGAETWLFDGSVSSASSSPDWVRVAEGVIQRLSDGPHQVEAAIVSTVPACCVDAYLAALGISVARGAQSLFSYPQSGEEIQQLVREIITSIIQQPFGMAYLMAADAGRPEYLLLVDTNTLEGLPIAAPARDEVGWGIVDVGMGPLRDASFQVKRHEMTREATDTLRRKGFPSLYSLRQLEHKDLKQALDVLPRRLRPIVRHLVTENRRVQKLVAALRRRDWQLFGALLLMSHSSLQKDWGATNELVDAVVHEAEAMSLEGIYGACMTGRGGCVLVAGQPFSIPRCLDRAQGALKEQFDLEADVMLL
jgi:galactokinase